jgi:hypothetical protein
MFYGKRFSAPRPTSSLEAQVSPFMPSVSRWPSYIPGAGWLGTSGAPLPALTITVSPWGHIKLQLYQKLEAALSLSLSLCTLLYLIFAPRYKPPTFLYACSSLLTQRAILAIYSVTVASKGFTPCAVYISYALCRPEMPDSVHFFILCVAIMCNKPTYTNLIKWLIEQTRNVMNHKQVFSCHCYL